MHTPCAANAEAWLSVQQEFCMWRAREGFMPLPVAWTSPGLTIVCTATMRQASPLLQVLRHAGVCGGRADCRGQDRAHGNRQLPGQALRRLERGRLPAH